MTVRLHAIAAALATTAFVPVTATAQETASAADDIAALKAQVEALSARVETLESALSVARSAQGYDDASAMTTGEDIAPSPPSITQGIEPETSITLKAAPLIETQGGWSFKPRGRLNIDAGFVAAPDSVDTTDGFGSELRRARLGVEGTNPGGFGYKFEADFAGNEVELADAILYYSQDAFSLTVGQHNSFQSLEELTSSRFTSFIERAAFTDAFNFERRLGISGQYDGEDVILQVGAFSDNIGDLPGKNHSFDGRAVWLPTFGDAQLHLGASVHYTDIEDDDTVRYRQRPLVHFTSTRFIDTRSFEANSEFGYGAEAAFISGPFHAAGEAFWQETDRPGDLADPTFFGGYAEAGLFLTPGDTRGYKNGQFDRVKPVSELGGGGPGAVQIVARYDYLDLNDVGIVGGMQNGYFLSLIWTPTDYTRLLLNYGRLAYDDAVLPAADGDTDYSVDSVGVRAQIDF